MRLIVRGFVAGTMVLEEPYELPDDDPGAGADVFAEAVGWMMANLSLPRLAEWEIEIEFLDEPDPDERFLCFSRTIH